MRNVNLIETLESRQLFAAGLTLGPNNLYFNAVKGQSQTYLLRVTNSGDQRVVLDRFKFVGDNASNFRVTDFPAARSLGVGVQINVTVQFTASSSQDNGIKTAQIRAFSNVPSKNGYANAVPVRGLPTNGTSGSSEPSLQKIFNLYGLPIDSGQTDIEDYRYPSTPSSTSDEIVANTFVKAGAGPVTVTPIGVFTNASTPAVRMGYYTPGDLDSEKYLWYVPSDTSQSVNPFYYGLTRFDPGSAEFGLMTQYPNFVNDNSTTREVYSESALNKAWSDSSTYNHFRVFPFINQAGDVVANAYIVAQEEFENVGVADNNDLMFVVTNVQPATATPTLAIENRVGYPDSDTLVFNKVQIPDANFTNIVRTSNTITLRNSGQSNLTVSLAVSGEYSITSGGGTNVSIAPGATRDVTVQFTTSNAAGDNALRLGALTITSNDPANATKTVELRGFWQRYSEQQGPGQPTVEPTAQEIVNDIFGYTTVLTNGGENLNSNGNVQQVGDEVLAQYFTAADSSAYVRVTALAAYHNQTYLDSDGVTNIPTNSYVGFYTKGNTGSYQEFYRDKPGTGQMVLPTPATTSNGGPGRSVGISTGRFRPSSPTQVFGFVVERRTPDANNGGGEYSDYSLNTFNPDNPANPRTQGQFLRFFPLRDKDGQTVPNTYIMLHDYNRDTGNYDFNDNVYIVSNVIPEGLRKAPALVGATRNANGVALNFSSPTDGPRITGFNVYRSTTARGAYSLLTNTPIVARPGNVYTDFSASSSQTYFYAIESVGPGGNPSDRAIVRI